MHHLKLCCRQPAAQPAVVAPIGQLMAARLHAISDSKCFSAVLVPSDVKAVVQHVCSTRFACGREIPFVCGTMLDSTC